MEDVERRGTTRYDVTEVGGPFGRDCLGISPLQTATMLGAKMADKAGDVDLYEVKVETITTRRLVASWRGAAPVAPGA